MANTTMNFDIERSLKESPPNFPKGVRHVKRIVTRRSNIDWGIRYQPKVGIYDTANVSRLKVSYGTHDFLYDQGVQIVTPSTTSDKEFEGVGGFQRDSAQEALEWDYTIVDVVEFESKLERRIFSFETNHIFAPRVGNTKTDIIYGVEQAITHDGLDQTDDDAIKAFIARTAADFSKSERESIFKTVRKKKGKFANMRPLDGNLANALAKELGLQYAGAKNKDVDGLAYVKEHGNSKTLYWDGLRLSLKYGGATITVYGYIADPKPSQLMTDRKTWMEQFNELIDFHYQVASQTTGEDIAKMRLSGWCPFVFGGFLPQDITPVGSNYTPKETGLVDENGRAMGSNVVEIQAAE